MATREVATYCRICEPQCGLIATVEDGRLVGVRGDKEHVHSKGFLCTKASGMIEVTYDPARVLRPLKRVGGPGEFEPVSWDEALADIAARLGRIRDEHGAAAFATFLGNPPGFGYATAMWYSAFQKTLGVKWKYCINSEDASARMAANALLYGSVSLMPLPDFIRSDFAIVIGANPIVSKGSLISLPHFREALDGIVERGGRVVVVDPRRTETARRYEHVGLRAGSDTYFLLGLLNVLVTEELIDRRFLAAHTKGYETLAARIEPFDVDHCAQRCGVDGGAIRALARAFAAAPSALVYGRTGTCTQRFGTFNNVLQDLVMILTGNVDRPGGLVFGWGPIDFATFAEKGGFATYATTPTRVTGLPDVFGMHPSTSLVPDITTPGDGQVRALMTLGCNPVITSAGGGPELEAALERLDLHFSLDFYVNDTNRHAHYVLPVPGMYERDDVPLPHLGLQLEPSIWATEAVIERRGDARPEWEILDELARRLGYGGAYAVAPLRWLAKAGVHVKPRTLADLLIRTSSAGDWFGLRRNGLSFGKLTRRFPHGKALRDDLPTGVLTAQLRTPDKRLPLAGPQILGEFDRLTVTAENDTGYPLRLLGRREVRSHNSWMHNVERLMPDGREQQALVHAVDAEASGLRDGEVARICSPSGSVEVAIHVTDEMTPGNVALPHGWGHRSNGWPRATRAGGVNSNVLASAAPEDLEPLAGMSALNGIPIRLEAVAATPDDGRDLEAVAAT